MLPWVVSAADLAIAAGDDVYASNDEEEVDADSPAPARKIQNIVKAKLVKPQHENSETFTEEKKME